MKVTSTLSSCLLGPLIFWSLVFLMSELWCLLLRSIQIPGVECFSLTETVETLTISVIPTIIWIYFSLSETLTLPFCHTHTPWQAACGEAAQGCCIILNIHQLSRDIILAPHLHTAPTEWQTRESERSLPLLSFVAVLTWLPFTPLLPTFPPSISLCLPPNLSNWITTSGSMCADLCVCVCGLLQCLLNGKRDESQEEQWALDTDLTPTPPTLCISVYSDCNQKAFHLSSGTFLSLQTF